MKRYFVVHMTVSIDERNMKGKALHERLAKELIKDHVKRAVNRTGMTVNTIDVTAR